jgi:hypothetical protein
VGDGMAERTVSEPDPRLSISPRVRRLTDDESLIIDTTKYMVGTLEWAGPVFQIAVLFGSAIYDPYTSYGRAIILGLAAGHVLLIPLYYRGFGPFSRGGVWLAFYFLQCVLINGLQEVLSRPGTYGNHILCVPGCNYSATAWLFLAFYPWLPPPLRIRRREVFEWPLLGLYYGYFLLLCWVNNGSLTWLNLKTCFVSFGWLLIGYLFGKAIGRMCVAAARKQLEVQQQNFAEFFDFLHSHVKSVITAIRIDLPDPARAEEKLKELETAIGEYRVELLLARDQVPLATLFSECIRTFAGVLEMTQTPRLGGLTVERPIGLLVGRSLGDLLHNAAKHGATAVQIACDLSAGRIKLVIADNGPGFPAEVLDDESRSLYRLRRTARDLGGDLIMSPQENCIGSVLTLTAPLHVSRSAR